MMHAIPNTFPEGILGVQGERPPGRRRPLGEPAGRHAGLFNIRLFAFDFQDIDDGHDNGIDRFPVGDRC
jgi:hypothetical protein